MLSTMPTAREEDAAYRSAWGLRGKRPFGRGLRAAFYIYLPDAPRGRFLTRADAAEYVTLLDRVAEGHRWPAHEREKLRALRIRWTRRAEGEDARFNALGVTGGVNERYRVPIGAERLAALRDAARPGPREPWPLGRPQH